MEPPQKLANLLGGDSLQAFLPRSGKGLQAREVPPVGREGVRRETSLHLQIMQEGLGQIRKVNDAKLPLKRKVERRSASSSFP